ncbi:MAG: signal peptidase I [Clostridium butyricum]|nr:signal peptidase I [Clostridium butyricum]
MNLKTIFNSFIKLFTASLILFVLFSETFDITVVKGFSMNNTIDNEDRVLLDMYTYEDSLPNYEDIVIIKRNYSNTIYVSNNNYLIKRVIGLPNDKIDIISNKLYRNNILISESYIKEPMKCKNMSFSIPEGKLFVMGDNRNDSLDSRSSKIGFIDIKNQLYAKAIYDLSQNKRI